MGFKAKFEGSEEIMKKYLLIFLINVASVQYTFTVLVPSTA